MPYERHELLIEETLERVFPDRLVPTERLVLFFIRILSPPGTVVTISLMTNTGHLTDIGPGDGMSSHIPPIFKSNLDKLRWCEAFKEWAVNVQVCAKEKDTIGMGIAATLVHTLYRSGPDDKKELVRRTVRTGERELIPNSGADPGGQ